MSTVKPCRMTNAAVLRSNSPAKTVLWCTEHDCPDDQAATWTDDVVCTGASLEYVEADLRVAKDRLAVAEKSWRTWQDIAVRWRQRFNRRNADADALRERVTALNAEVHRLRSTSVRGDA